MVAETRTLASALFFLSGAFADLSTAYRAEV